MSKPSRAELRLIAEPEYCNCGKVMYDKKGAQTAKNARMKKDHVPLRIYPCPDCNHWHLTSRNPYGK